MEKESIIEMDTIEILDVTHRGYIRIGGKEISCAVLENGQRVVAKTSLYDAFDRKKKGGSKEPITVGFPSIIDAKNLLPYMNEEILDKCKPIYYKHSNGRMATGYEAEIIPLICELYLTANDNGALTHSQKHLAERAMIIIRAFAKVGITALIDEATGYQYDRQAQELQKLLEAYINKDLAKWQKRFPNEFFKEIFRLYGWEYKSESNKRPQVVGTFINKYVYDMLPEEVMEEIRELNPIIKSGNKAFRKYNHHQYLTPDIGIPHLDHHIFKLLGVMKLSDNIKEFEANFDKAFDEELALKKDKLEGF